jgi:hypothetical protein
MSFSGAAAVAVDRDLNSKSEDFFDCEIKRLKSDAASFRGKFPLESYTELMSPGSHGEIYFRRVSLNRDPLLSGIAVFVPGLFGDDCDFMYQARAISIPSICISHWRGISSVEDFVSVFHGFLLSEISKMRQRPHVHLISSDFGVSLLEAYSSLHDEFDFDLIFIKPHSSVM